MVRKDAGLFCGSFRRNGEVFAQVGTNHNLQDLRVIHGHDHTARVARTVYEPPPHEALAVLASSNPAESNNGKI